MTYDAARFAEVQSGAQVLTEHVTLVLCGVPRTVAYGVSVGASRGKPIGSRVTRDATFSRRKTTAIAGCRPSRWADNYVEW